MARYVFSPRAQRDIDDIWNYTVTQWGARQAELYIRAIQSAVETIAAHPQHGKACSAIRAGYHKYPAGSHVVFYRVDGNGIQVIRILHTRMDFEAHF